MASEIRAISPAAFAEAIKELPLSAVHSKVLELRNSIAHLHRSNAELRLFMAESAETEDLKELEGYVAENEGVIASMGARVELLKTELENRGQPWIEVEEVKAGENGESEEGSTEAPVTNGTEGETRGSNGNTQQEEDGVYL